jgi:hypothetical protein
MIHLNVLHNGVKSGIISANNPFKRLAAFRFSAALQKQFDKEGIMMDNRNCSGG